MGHSPPARPLCHPKLMQCSLIMYKNLFVKNLSSILDRCSMLLHRERRAMTLMYTTNTNNLYSTL